MWFRYSTTSDPAKLVEGGVGDADRHEVETHVRIRFPWKVARLVERRMWHPSYKIEKEANCIVSTTIARTAEPRELIWSPGPDRGARAAVVARTRVREELRRARADESPGDRRQ